MAEAYHPRRMHPAKYWLPAFVALFACYHLPEVLQLPMLMLAFLPAAWLVARALKLRVGTAYALEWNRAAAAYLAGGFLLALLAKLGALWSGTRLGLYAHVSGTLDWRELALAIAWTLPFTFVPSVAEDILTRGFWARVPEGSWTAWRFVLFTSALYVLNHLYRLGNGPTEWLMLFCFGLAYGTAFWRTGSLWAAVGLHWGWNFSGTILGAWWTDVRSGAGWWLSAITHLLLAAACLGFFSRAPGACGRRGSAPTPTVGR